MVVLRFPAGLSLSEVSRGADEPPPAEEELLTLLRKSFQSVELAVQTAFVGYSITPMGVGPHRSAMVAGLL